MVEVTVAIPTFRRPKSLQRLLAELERLETDVSVSVVVADNDAERHEGVDLCARMRGSYRWPLASLVVAERGIAAVRNALVERALSASCDFIAMLDDDEWPDPSWLTAFLEVQKQTGADAIQGSILFEHEDSPSLWALRCDGTGSIRRPSGPVDMLQGAGNLLLKRDCLAGIEPCFDTAFSLGGGEDLDFFRRLAKRGKRFAWADEAIARSTVPASRMRLGWVLARAYSVGNSDMRVFLKHDRGAWELAVELTKIAAALLLSPLMLVILLVVPNRAVDVLRTLCRAAGKLGALCGLHYHEYAITHGG